MSFMRFNHSCSNSMVMRKPTALQDSSQLSPPQPKSLEDLWLQKSACYLGKEQARCYWERLLQDLRSFLFLPFIISGLRWLLSFFGVLRLQQLCQFVKRTSMVLFLRNNVQRYFLLILSWDRLVGYLS